MQLHTNTRWLLASALTLGLLAPAVATGEEYTASRKAGRGAAAITTGFLEIPGNTLDEVSERGLWAGIPIGFGRGVAFAIRRVLVGSYELVTAPFELPAGFEPIIEPEFAWDYFDSNYLEKEEDRIDSIAGAEVLRRRGALVVRFPDQLLFQYGSSELTPEARGRLDRLAVALRQSPDARIQVRGFTDSSGPEVANTQLSLARAEAVRSYLVDQGVAASRLEADGFGSARPVASNDTAIGRHRNRRVEFEVRASGVAARR